ncbi:helicase-related protein [Mahella australiensis]|uniref:Helicase domain protein n=1 Tax=Mahella australiensis (strain DSM 15567 / CIP 107919 / 50-1 BON) TaxID=697281 RepID=F4A0D9_MAHA5|nr:helicase-related protein [Mahella australiensis]AEE98000.1 helicase domain protein [Mahella australiensis 50-1 BON]
MAKLEELRAGTVLKGILADSNVTVIDAKWVGNVAVELTYKDNAGNVGNELLFRDKEPTIEVVQKGLPWSFTADGEMLRLTSEAYRIRLAYLFDPYLAVHTSMIEPLPHQITAVYDEMLKRQPLRFLLADDPGSGKTIMAGLLIKELLVRGDLARCLIVVPGNLAEQWQDEMSSKFNLPFEIITNDRIEAARSGNIFLEVPLCIARLDKLARDEDIQNRLAVTDWDLIICDEAHKMSATFFGGERKYTKRYKLGQLLSKITRNFLLLTATPHNGKEEDFQLFMALLDGDRFEGKFRDGYHNVDVSDMMRRLVKEDLLKFDGTPLFPERIAYTVNYKLSDQEAALYKEVTDYVREEFNRADALNNEGRKGTVGFALTALQRRLASSPEAIYQSLRRRRERLEKRLREERIMKRGADAVESDSILLTQDEIEDMEDAPDAEVQAVEEAVVDQATAARTIAELEAEIDRLKTLEAMAYDVKRSGHDRKWDELSALLQQDAHMFDAENRREKLIIFTEHRDTLNYLTEKIRTLLGNADAVVNIHGGMLREERRKAQERFTQDKDVRILVATDAAGEGINLQRAHLMINYDLPWNPNRLEQRFGRIHRIGQTEVCHCWNLVADETREGDVFRCLLNKLEEERKAPGGRVFDILGKITFDDKPLKDLLIEAIRYGDRPDVRERLTRVVENALDTQYLRKLFEEQALVRDVMDVSKVMEVKEEMERADARRLQPHFIESFFLEAFTYLGGRIRQKERGRYEITFVPAEIRNRDRAIGTRQPVLSKYERVCFEKTLINVQGKSVAELICPGHPLLDAVISLIMERNADILKRGAILVDETGVAEPRLLFYIEHAIQDGRTDANGKRRLVSKRVHFVEMDSSGGCRNAGYAPYLDYRALKDSEMPEAQRILDNMGWLKGDIEDIAVQYAVSRLVPEHFEEVRNRKVELVDKTMAAVRDRLTKEITYWDRRAQEFKEQEQAGKPNAGLNYEKAAQRADELAGRLQKRMQELEQEKRLSPLPPVIIGGALIIPAAMLKGEEPATFARDTDDIERAAMQAVMAVERRNGFEPRDVSADKCGYDIESRAKGGGLRFIEVKGRTAGSDTVTVTKNEILTALNKPDDYILALVEVDGQKAAVRYIKVPFKYEPDFAATSVNYDIKQLMAAGESVYFEEVHLFGL